MTARERDVLRKSIKAGVQTLSSDMLQPFSRQEIRKIVNITLRYINCGMTREQAYVRAIDRFMLSRRPKRFSWLKAALIELWQRLSRK